MPDGFDVREITIGQKMRILADLPLLHHPGARFTYGLSADMLGYLVEVVSGVPLDRFLQERIFEPLKMRDTHFYLPEEKAMRLAPLYGPAEDGQLKRVDLLQPPPLSGTGLPGVDGKEKFEPRLG